MTVAPVSMTICESRVCTLIRFKGGKEGNCNGTCNSTVGTIKVSVKMSSVKVSFRCQNMPWVCGILQPGREICCFYAYACMEILHLASGSYAHLCLVCDIPSGKTFGCEAAVQYTCQVPETAR